MTAVPVPITTECVTIRPWSDVVIDQLGHDPRSQYAETYWLSVLGPTTTWLLRMIAAGLEEHPDGFDLDLADTARAIGLGDRCGRQSPLTRGFTRLVQFDLAQPLGSPVLAVRRKVPPLTRRQVERLPAALQSAHEKLVAEHLRTPSVEHMRHRARQLALSLLELGEDLEAGEHQLLRWNFHPALAREAATWAWERHCANRAASAGAPSADNDLPHPEDRAGNGDGDHVHDDVAERRRRGLSPVLGILPDGDAA